MLSSYRKFVLSFDRRLKRVLAAKSGNTRQRAASIIVGATGLSTFSSHEDTNEAKNSQEHGEENDELKCSGGGNAMYFCDVRKRN